MRRTTLVIAAATAVAALAGAFKLATPAEARLAAPKPNIVQTAAAAGEFKTLASLLKTAGLVRTLQQEGPFTVFAPTDAAFAKVPKATLASLAKNQKRLRAVLLYHVASGRVKAGKVVNLDSVQTLNGASARVRVRNGSVYVGGARVVTPDVMASNGVIHVVNKVLLPPQ